jgi:hypothetical protein
MWYRRNTDLLWLPVLVLLMAGCGGQEPRRVNPAFYHWKSRLSLSGNERALLDSLQCKKLYVKVLDVGTDPASGNIQPYARLESVDTTGLSGRGIVPVVFITNAVFQQITKEKIDWLADKILSTPHLHAIIGSSPAGKPGSPPRWGGEPFTPPPGGTGGAIQFDCDWTASTRDAFFLFLRRVRERLPEGTVLSATIRLHQYKFPDQTGVPPVDRGMLMFYNTGDIDDPNTVNSVFYPDDARKYLSGKRRDYPLPLDLALPLFSWGLVYRDGELWKIVPEVAPEDWTDTARFEQISRVPATFRIRKGTFLAAHYLRPGDQMRLESISPELLMEAARLAAPADLAGDADLAFFHLDSAIIRRFSVQQLDSVCQVINFSGKK